MLPIHVCTLKFTLVNWQIYIQFHIYNVQFALSNLGMQLINDLVKVQLGTQICSFL